MRGNLFLCVANSARRPMAQGIARAVFPQGVRVWSAVSSPTYARSEVIAVLREIGIDISGRRSKSGAKVPTDQVDTAVTLCGGNVTHPSHGCGPSTGRSRTPRPRGAQRRFASRPFSRRGTSYNGALRSSSLRNCAGERSSNS
jgi:hypothetical protein